MFPVIPIEGLNYDEESDFEGELVAFGFAAACCGYYSHAPAWEELQQRLGSTATLPACVRSGEHRCHFNQSLFTARCLAEPSPVREFPVILDLLSHETDCLFLDSASAYENYEHSYTWSTKDIRLLSKEWKRGQQIHATATRCARTLEAHPHYWNTIFHHWDALCRTSSKGNS